MPQRVPTYRPPRPALAKTKGKQDKSPEAADRHRFYCTARWTKLRAMHIAQHPLCQRCLSESRITQASHVHHEQEVKDRPDLALDMGNLTSLCASCHTRHHNEARRST
jgi:5-methylcytosine-specific restriction enzyme A